MSAPGMSVHRGVVQNASHGLARRCMDLAVAGAASMILAPVMLLITLLLLLEGGRQVLYVQTRLGTGGEPFRMYKFRKFHVGCSRNGLPLTVAGDDRMTRIGQFLAATKLDELPQLWNVLRGDMAIVGPRPESLEFADCFRGGLEAVLEYKPGLLGPSQVRYRHEARFFPKTMEPVRFYREVLFPAKARLDLNYYPQRTILTDMTWIWRGVVAVFGPAGAAVSG